MRVLLDESVPRRLARELPPHEVRTVVQMGWGGIKNGRLLSLAAQQFDVLRSTRSAVENGSDVLAP